MCSVDPDELTEMVRATNELDIGSGDVLCRKCKETMAEVVLRAKDPYCRDCFLAYFDHKFRSTIGKSKQFRLGDEVLVATSGGASSTTLLHLIHSGLIQNSHKRLCFKATYLHIDESCLYEESDGDAKDLASKVCREVVSLGYSCYITSIQQVMAPELMPPSAYCEEWQKVSQHQNNDETLKKQLHSLLRSCKSNTNREDLEEQLRMTLILQCARALGYKKVLLANNSTSTAIRILSRVAIGRGSHLPYQVHFKTIVEDMEVYRPMRELLDTEIHYYMKLHGMTAADSYVRHQRPGTSIIKCSEDFLRGLQEEFPATVPTVFRTGDKLKPSTTTTTNSLGSSKCSSTLSVSGDSQTDLKSSSEVEPKMKLEREPCVLCRLPLDTDQGPASALKATEVSLRLNQFVSSTGGSHQKYDWAPIANGTPDVGVKEKAVKKFVSSKKQEKLNYEAVNSSDIEDVSSCECGSSTGCCSSRNTSDNTKQDEPVPEDNIEEHLCYGCRILLRDMNDVRLLPASMQRAVGVQERRRHMRQEIQDFLL